MVRLKGSIKVGIGNEAWKKGQMGLGFPGLVLCVHSVFQWEPLFGLPFMPRFTLDSDSLLDPLDPFLGHS